MKLSGDGKKADLVARILEHQGGDASSTSAAVPEASTTPADATVPTGPNGNATNAAASSSEAAAVSGGAVTSTAGTAAAATKSTQGENTDEAPAKAAQESKEPALPLPAGTDKNDEAEKRLNRLKRFGNPEDIAKLQRAEKFGTQADGVDDKVSCSPYRFEHPASSIQAL